MVTSNSAGLVAGAAPRRNFSWMRRGRRLTGDVHRLLSLFRALARAAASLAAAALLVAAPVDARADGAWVAPRGALPCSTAELRDALALRLTLAARPDLASLQIEIAATGDRDAVTVTAAGKAREVSLDGARGAAAARLIALAISDLALAELDPMAAPAAPGAAIGGPPGMAGAGRTGDSGIRIDGAADSRGDAGGLRIALLGWSNTPADSGPPWIGAGVDLLLPRGNGGWGLTAGAGFAASATEEGQQLAITLYGVPMRAGVALRPGRGLELRLAGVVMPIHAVTSGDASDDYLLAGGNAEVRLRLRVADRLALVAGGGADLFANRVRYTTNGQPELTTPRAVLSVGLGLDWELGR
jgi:hypothetical protein